jgi:cell division septal protein FtsQ
MEIATARERRRRRLVVTVVATLFVALTLGGLYWFVVRELPVFEISEVEITGLDTGTEEGRQVAEAIRSATGQMTTLNVDQGLLDEEMERFPRVESATVDADFPDSATVTVRERRDAAIFGEDEDALLIAADGTVLGSPGDQADELPLISEGEPPEEDRLDGIALNQAIVLGAVPRELQGFLDRSEVTGSGVEVTLSNGLILLFGDPGQAGKKWKAAAAVIADPELADAGYVDVSVPRRPAVSQRRPRNR